MITLKDDQYTGGTLFLPFLALVLCSPIDGMASIIFYVYYMEMLDHSILVSGSISFKLPPYTEREKPSEYCTLLLWTAGIKPGPPAQQASALSITPLPLGYRR